jgi:hypothetical protein
MRINKLYQRRNFYQKKLLLSFIVGVLLDYGLRVMFYKNSITLT